MIFFFFFFESAMRRRLDGWGQTWVFSFLSCRTGAKMMFQKILEDASQPNQEPRDLHFSWCMIWHRRGSSANVGSIDTVWWCLCCTGSFWAGFQPAYEPPVSCLHASEHPTIASITLPAIIRPHIIKTSKLHVYLFFVWIHFSNFFCLDSFGWV